MFAPNGTYFRDLKEDPWRRGVSSNWEAAPEPNYTPTHEGRATLNNDVHLRSNIKTAVMPCQSTVEAQSLQDQAMPVDDPRPVWTQLDCLQSHLDMDCKVTRGPIFTDRRMDDDFPSVAEWDENDVWETSTTLDESEYLLKRPVRRVAKNGWKGTHQCSSSGSTQGPGSTGTLPGESDLNAAERVRAWQRVGVMLGRHKGQKTGSRPVARGF